MTRFSSFFSGLFTFLRPGNRARQALHCVGVVAVVLALGACAGSGNKEKFAYVEQPVEQLYSRASERLERKRFPEAIALYEEVERQHPFTAWARRATLMKAFALYQQNDYDESIGALDQFLALHPGNNNVPYAYYLKAMNYYERIRDVGRDQEFTNNAVASLTDVVRRAPDTEYARDARLKLDLTFDHLAGKEMYVGRFYLRNNKHIAAINRFKYVINTYQTTSHVPEALHRLVEAYIELGIFDEAVANAAVLGHNYPGTKWYADSYRLIQKLNVTERQQAVITRARQRAYETANPKKATDKTDAGAEENGSDKPPATVGPPPGEAEAR
ncbi:MAG: outer membrane protein assembly factor BamD [Pseudomonadota bacterium]